MDKRKSSYKEPIIFTLEFYLVTKKWLRVFIQSSFILLFIVGLIYFLPKLFPQTVQKEINSNIYGFLGVLVGVVVSGVVSLYLHNQELLAEASIQKKNEIYKPLYEDLIKFEQKIQQNEYPLYIHTNPRESKAVFMPYLVKWNEIKLSPFFYSVPNWLVEAFDAFMMDLEEYTILQEIAAVAVRDCISDLIHESFDLEFPKWHPAEIMYLRDILIEDNTHFLRDFISENDDQKTKKQKTEFWKTVQFKCSQLDEVLDFRLFYESKVINTSFWLRNELGKIIRLINIRFEKQKRFY